MVIGIPSFPPLPILFVYLLLFPIPFVFWAVYTLGEAICGLSVSDFCFLGMVLTMIQNFGGDGLSHNGVWFELHQADFLWF